VSAGGAVAAARRPDLLVSVHDATPRTLPVIHTTLEWLAARGVTAVTVLVVPGSGWDDTGVAALRRLAARGCALAGHGWEHRAGRLRTPMELLHAGLISRHEGEHLGRPREEILARITHCHRWFAGAGLPAPALYVPPAWALGRLPRRERARLPFPMLETLSGLEWTQSRRSRRLPLAGFQADTPARARLLRQWNRLNTAASLRTGRPLRVAIHPGDLALPLAASLEALLACRGRVLDYAEL